MRKDRAVNDYFDAALPRESVFPGTQDLSDDFIPPIGRCPAFSKGDEGIRCVIFSHIPPRKGAVSRER
jgi:hypothetical protein